MKALGDKVRTIADSGLFDREWYAARYRDVPLLGMDEVEHFVRFGAAMGRDPGPGFDTAYYLHSYPDVARNGMNPLLHYIVHGRREGRTPTPGATVQPPPEPVQEAGPADGSVPSVDMHGTRVLLSPHPSYATAEPSGSETVDGPCAWLDHAAAVKSTPATPDVGIHLHAHYLDQLPEIAGFLASIPQPFRLYVSVHGEGQVETARASLEDRLPQATLDVRAVPNVGRDIAPLVVEFAQDLLKHDIVAHVHTKRSPHNGAKRDWRRQLLMNLMGTPGIVRSVFELLDRNPHIGLVFPEYHHSLRGQISWGTNFGPCSELADRLGLSISKESMTLFPAGSMFWARSAALAPLLDAGLGYDDFPDEQGQVDGTTAHAIERLFGAVAVSAGFHLLQAKSDKPHDLRSYFPYKWKFPLDDALPALAVARRYREARSARADGKAKVVVYTALAGGYEHLLPQLNLDPAFDYVAFTDAPANDCGIWDVRPMDYWNPDPVRMARYVKTHPHRYFPDHDYAIWIDANVIVRGELAGYLHMVQAAGAGIGGIPHPVRQCIYQEAEAVIAARKDSAEVIGRQLEGYRKRGFPGQQGLIETNLMVMDLRHPATTSVLDEWWKEIDSGSRRDQLSLNYVLWKQKVDWVPLMGERASLRDTFDFAYFGHGRNSGFPADLRTHALGGQVVDPYRRTSPEQAIPAARPAVDIVICIHDALDEVRNCLASVLRARGSEDRIVLVDDASGPQTAACLREFSASNPRVDLLRHEPPARGYCRAANAGMARATAPLVLLLNSDTVLAHGALEKMVALVTSRRDIGIVGPMSNAASSQSLPDIKGSAGQTAINALPPGSTVDQMDEACEAWSLPGVQPSVPLVHGFCQLIRKEVIEATGGFDEAAFPNGYGEENDLCMRAADLGFDLKIATNAYVFHEKSASYTDAERRQALMRQGAEQLRRKHSAARVAAAIAIMEGHPLLERMRTNARALFREVRA